MSDSVKIIEEICEITVSDYKPQEKLQDVLQWDSFAILNFMAEVENQYHYHLTVEDMSEIETIEELIQLLDEKRQEE